jgi:hypothetical protein
MIAERNKQKRQSHDDPAFTVLQSDVDLFLKVLP